MSNKIDSESIHIELARLLEKQRIELNALQDQWTVVVETIGKESLIPSVFGSLLTSKNRNNSIIQNVVGSVSRLLIDKLYPNTSGGILATISKRSIKFIAHKFIASHSNQILTIGMKLLKSIINNTQTS